MSLPDNHSLDEASKAVHLQSIVSLNTTETETTPFNVEDIRARPEIWPTQSKLLKPGKLMEATMTLYDGLLCALSVALIVKTTLCIIANRLEIYGGDANAFWTSSLTLTLLKLNEQVWQVVLMFSVTMSDPAKASHRVHDHLRHNSVDICQTIGIV